MKKWIIAVSVAGGLALAGAASAEPVAASPKQQAVGTSDATDLSARRHIRRYAYRPYVRPYYRPYYYARPYYYRPYPYYAPAPFTFGFGFVPFGFY